MFWGNVLQASALIFAGSRFTRNALRPAKSLQYSKGWMWLSFGTWIWVIGQVLQAYAEILLQRSGFGTVDDAFWLLGVFCIIGGLSVLVLHFSQKAKFKSAHLYTLAFLGSLIVLLAIANRGLFNGILKVIYISCDLIVIALLFVLIISGKKRRDQKMVFQWSIFLIGAISGSIGDVLWTSQANTITDLLFFSDYLLIGLSAMLASCQSIDSRQYNDTTQIDAFVLNS